MTTAHKRRISNEESKRLRENGQRKCPKCGEIKSFSDYYTAGNSKNYGYPTHCKSCMNEIGKTRYKDKPEEYHKRYIKSRRSGRNTKLKKKFGITLEDYERMLAEQGGVCAICGELDLTKSLAVDHNHSTGKVRGLLCSRCNPAIGYLKDDPELARKLVAYLEKYQNGIPIDR